MARRAARALLLALALTETAADQGRKRLRGAAREVADVVVEMSKLENIEHLVEHDLQKVLLAFANGTSGDGFAEVLGARLLDMRKDLASLVRTINATRAELAEARDAVGSTEKALESARGAERRARLAERLREGRVAVNYETGEVSALSELLTPQELKRLAAQIGSDNRTTLEAHLLRESYLPAHGARRFAKARGRADPAKLHLDARFLQDVVALSLATAVGGLAAALLAAPNALGYMVGGVLVGPSGLNLIYNLEQTETVAQFGSIFLLFSHGLMYSHYYDHRRRKRARDARRRGELSPTSSKIVDEGGDEGLEGAPEAARRAWAVGFMLVGCLAVAFAGMIPLALGGDHSSAEVSLVAAAFALSSSSTVLSTLQEARLEETLFGHTIIELLSVQDLILAPLLALPTAVHELRQKTHLGRGSFAGWLAGVAGGYLGACALVVFLARRVLPRALGALTRKEAQLLGDEEEEQLERAERRRGGSFAAFGLCVVGYALAMALLGDRLKLSHEAGALFAGLVLVGTPHVDRAKAAVAPLAALFGGMYVASLGLVISPRYLQSHFSAVFGHVLFVVAVKVAVVGPLVHSLGFSKSAAAGAGGVFAQVSEVALFVAARAHDLELVTRHTYLDVLSTTIVLLAVAPLFVHILRRVDRRQFLSLDEGKRGDQSLAEAALAPLRCAAVVLGAPLRIPWAGRSRKA